MNFHRCCLIVSLWLVLLGTVKLDAQTPAPQSAYRFDLPSNAHWITTFKRAGEDKDAKSGSRKVIFIDITKTGRSRRIVLKFSDGTSEQYDEAGEYLLTDGKAGAELAMIVKDPPPYPYYSAGILFVDSTGAGRFKGAVSYQGTTLYHYETPTGEFWVDPASQLPTAAKDGSVEVQFQFLAPPQESLTLSPAKAALLQKQESVRRAFHALR